MRKLLLGDEAIAQAAIDSGLSGVYAYPGTPSTEITEFIQLREEKRGDADNKIFCRWATNEKTAMEGALGMSYMGKRSLTALATSIVTVPDFGLGIKPRGPKTRPRAPILPMICG